MERIVDEMSKFGRNCVVPDTVAIDNNPMLSTTRMRREIRTELLGMFPPEDIER